MFRHLIFACCAVLVTTACSKKDDPGAATANVASDTRVLKQAQDAVNEVLRNAADCDAAKAALATAQSALDEADRNVRTPTGQQTLQTLRAQVRTIVQNCP
jgi:hypothetical protein